jgi:hypothetical protein
MAKNVVDAGVLMKNNLLTRANVKLRSGIRMFIDPPFRVG